MVGLGAGVDLGMSAMILAPDVERFRALVTKRLGIRFDDAKLPFLAEVLGRRLVASRASAERYFVRLDAMPDPEEIGELARELTVPESYFFRNADQFRAFAEVALPERMRERGALRHLRILSAGCAAGEEPYSLAIVSREAIADPAWEVSILAIDINPSALERASLGRYTNWALREAPQDMQQRWFQPDGRDFVLNEGVRRNVRFEVRNLVDDDSELWRPESFDVVFCRNVAMYFASEVGRTVIARISRALVPGGYLFLGHAETLRGLSNDFHLCHTHGTFYYRRKREAETFPTEPPAPMPIREEPSTATSAQAPEDPATWVDAIRGAHERIEVLARMRSPPTTTKAVLGDDAAGWNLRGPLELLRGERFAEALDLLRALPAEAALDPDALLLHAVLLLHRGELDGAKEVCRRLLALDELSAGAQYVLALLCEHSGDRAGAVEHDQVAIYLDPSFAMPRLHLGLLARRAGDREAARRDLTDALALLRREDASRLLLFGGGFGRETLVALCRAELLACGGSA